MFSVKYENRPAAASRQLQGKVSSADDDHVFVGGGGSKKRRREKSGNTQPANNNNILNHTHENWPRGGGHRWV